MTKKAATGILTLFIGFLVATFPACAEKLRGRIPLLDLAEGQIVGANAHPWSAIGKLNNGMGGSCTAVMVSPRYALTAAHCLYLKKTDRFLPPQSFHLILGYEKQKYREHFLISAYYVPSKYDPRKPYETLESDWALLSIDRDAREKLEPLPVSVGGVPSVNSTLMTAGYSHRTPYAMTADKNCNLIGRSQDRNFFFDTCNAPSGFSGAPILIADAKSNSVSIAGIHVANQAYKTNHVGIAISIKHIWPEIKPCVQSDLCKFQHAANGRDPTAAEVLDARRITQLSSSRPSCEDDGLDCTTAPSRRQHAVPIPQPQSGTLTLAAREDEPPDVGMNSPKWRDVAQNPFPRVVDAASY